MLVGVAPHGGISPETTRAWIDRAHGRVLQRVGHGVAVRELDRAVGGLDVGGVRPPRDVVPEAKEDYSPQNQK